MILTLTHTILAIVILCLMFVVNHCITTGKSTQTLQLWLIAIIILTIVKLLISVVKILELVTFLNGLNLILDILLLIISVMFFVITFKVKD